MINKIQTFIEPIVSSKDAYIEDIEFVQEKNNYYLRIYCEKNEGHIDMDTIVELSELISDKLDEIDLIDQEYFLEVSSPGAERELKNYESVVKAKGEYVYIKLKDPKNGLDELYATILDINHQQLTLEYMVKNIKKKMEIDYSNISFIRMAVKF